MQRLAGLRLPHVLPMNTALTNIQIRSIARYRRRQFLKRERPEETPLYEISSLLLDLDAEECPYVRPYVEETEGEPPPTTLYHRTYLARHRALGFEKAARAYDYNFKIVKEDRFSVWRISDYDILSFVLDSSFILRSEKKLESTDTLWQDPNILKPLATSYEKSSILQRNGIPARMQRRFARVIPYILRRQQITRRLNPSVGNPDTLGRALDRTNREPDAERLLSYQRIIENVIQTPEGVKLVSKCSSTLGDLCEKIAPLIPPERLLTFLNNVVINLQSHRLPISPILLRCAYQASYECCCLPMVQKYMGMVHRTGDDVGPRLVQALHIFQQMMRFPDKKPGEDKTHLLLSIYGLLTGRLPGEDDSHPSFLDHISSYTSEQFAGYLTCLARLGAFRSMWYIWHAYPKDTTSEQASDATVKEIDTLKRTKGEAFTQAIVYAVGANSRFPELLRSPGFGDATEERHGDCELEIQTIMASGNLLLGEQSEGNQPKRVVSKEKIKKIFKIKTIGKAMRALQSYLLDEILDPNAEETLEEMDDEPTQG